MKSLNPKTVLGIHIGTILFLSYLAWAILYNSPIPKLVGYLIISIILSTTAVYAYTYYKKDNTVQS